MKLMKMLAVMITLFCSLAGAQIYRPINGWCEVGGQGVYAAKSGGTTPVQQYTQGSYTGCTISVFLHGTATLATLYSNSTGTSQANPFQASVLGFYQAFATSGLYDVQESGTVNPPVSLGTVSLLDISTYSPAGGSNTQVQYNCSGSLCGSANFTWSGSTVGVVGGVTASGTIAATTLTASAGASITGSLLVSGFGNITGSLGMGIGQFLGTPAITAVGLALVEGTGDYGNYAQFTPITYPSLTCLDSYGDQVGIPTVAPNGQPLGPNDLLLWNSLSPLPVTTGPGGCPTALPPNLDYGLNTNGYFFARAGFATDIGAFNSFHSLVGGFTGATFESGGFYPPGTVTHCCGTLTDYKYLGGHMAMGHSDGPPAVGTIATVNNPLIGFEGLIQGMFYWDDTLGSARIYNGTTWGPFGGGGGSGPTGPQYSIQTNSPIGSFHGDLNFTYVPGVTNFVTLGTGVFQATGTSGGFDATQGTASNTIQAPAGGMTALSFSAVNYIQSGNYSSSCAGGPPLTGIDVVHAGALAYCVGTGEYVYNGTSWVVLAGSGTVTHSAGALTSNAVVLGNGAGDLTVMASLGTTGFVLTSQGAGTPPIWSNVSGTGTVTHTAGALTAALPVFGNGGADIKVGTISGNTTLVMSGGAGSFTSGHTAVFDANGNIIDSGAPPVGFWINSGSNLYPTSIAYSVLVGETTNVSGAALEIRGAISTQGTASVIQSTSTGTNHAFQNSNSNFIVDGNGVVSSASFANFIGGYEVNGTSVIDSSRNSSFLSLTINGNSIVSSAGGIQSPVTGAGHGFQLANNDWIVDGTGNMSMVGNLNNVGGAYEISGVISINTSNQFVGAAVNTTGVVQSQVTGTSHSFQNSNSNFIVDGNGNISGAGVINMLTGFSANGNAGVNCSGLPTVGFTVSGGIVTHC